MTSARVPFFLVGAYLALVPGCGESPSVALDAAGGFDAGPALDAPGLDAFVADDVRATGDTGSADTATPSDDTTTGADAGAVADAGMVADAGAPTPEGCFSSVAAGHHLFTCDGIAFDVEISTACSLGGCGLILDVHGATMDAASEDLNTNLRALGAARGYVVVQPTAPSSTFLGRSWDPVADDPRVFSFVMLTMRAMRINPARVHMTGFSQGGFMSWRMLCDHADIFASVAPAAACGTLFRGCPFTPSARPSEEIPVLYIHGRSDPIVGGCYAAQRAAVVAGWSMTLDATVSMNAEHTWSRYVSASGNVFESIDHGYSAYSTILSGHCLPGSPDIGTSRFGTTGYGCEEPVAFDWGESVIAFFEAHPRR